MTQQFDSAGQPYPPQRPTATVWAAQFQHANGREPTLTEYQTAVANGQIAKDRDPSVQQITDGAKQLASGAKDFFSNRIVPGAKQFYADQVASNGRGVAYPGRPGGGVPSQQPPTQFDVWISRAPIIASIAAFFLIISLFLPAASYGRQSINYISADGGEGGFLLVAYLLTIGASVTALFVHRKWSRITGGTIGAVVGLISAMDAFSSMSSIYGGASVGVGLILMAILSIVLILSAAAILLSLRGIGARLPRAVRPQGVQYPESLAGWYPTPQGGQYSANPAGQYPTAQAGQYPTTSQGTQYPVSNAQGIPPIPPPPSQGSSNPPQQPRPQQARPQQP